MMATYSPFLNLDVDAGNRMDGLIAHHVGFHQVPGADDDAVAAQLFAALYFIHFVDGRRT